MSELAALIPVGCYQPEVLEKNVAIAEWIFKSGFCKPWIKNPQSVLYVMQRAISLGIDPMDGLDQLYLINGNWFIGIHLCKSMIARAGGRWKVTELTDKTAKIEFSREGWETHTEVFDESDFQRARLADKPTWKAHAKQIVFANAFRRGANVMFSDVLRGYRPLDESEIGEARSEGIEASLQQVKEQLPRQKMRIRPPQVIEHEVTPEDPAQGVTFSDIPGENIIDYPPTPLDDTTATLADILGSVATSSQVTETFNYRNSDHRSILTDCCLELKVPQKWKIANRESLVDFIQRKGITPDRETVFAALKEYIHEHPIA